MLPIPFAAHLSPHSPGYVIARDGGRGGGRGWPELGRVPHCIPLRTSGSSLHVALEILMPTPASVFYLHLSDSTIQMQFPSFGCNCLVMSTRMRAILRDHVLSRD